MPTIGDRLTTGERHDVTVRVVTDDGDPVRRDDLVRVERRAGGRTWLLADRPIAASGESTALDARRPGDPSDAGDGPAPDPLVPGRWYDLESALGYDPTGEAIPRPVERVRRRSWYCPDCGAETTYRYPAVDPPPGTRDEVRAAGVDDLVLVETAATTVRPRQTVDRWSFPDGIGVPDDARERSRSIVHVPGEFVCPDCGHATANPDRTPGGRSARSVDPGPRDEGDGDDDDGEAGGDHGSTDESDADDRAGPVSDAVEDLDDVDLPPSVGGATAETVPLDARGEFESASADRDPPPDLRAAVAAGDVPPAAVLTDAVAFRDHRFDLESGDRETLSTAVSDHPLTDDREWHVAVDPPSPTGGDRPPVDLVVALDVSASMAGPIPANDGADDEGADTAGDDPDSDDRTGDRGEDTDGTDDASETDDPPALTAAARAVADLVDRLRPEDRLGVVLYDGSGGVATPVEPIATTDRDALREHLLSVAANGPTDHVAGYETAREALADLDAGDATDADDRRFQRILLVTDEVPVVDARRPDALLGPDRLSLYDPIDEAAGEGVHTTLVAIAPGDAPDPVAALSGVARADYRPVRSQATLDRLVAAPDRLLAPPPTLQVAVEGASVVRASGPVARRDGNVRITPPDPPALGDHEDDDGGDARADPPGGVALLRLAIDDRDSGDPVELTLRRERSVDRRSLSPPDDADFDSPGVRKAVLLARYAALLRAWASTVGDRDRSGYRAVDVEDLIAADESPPVDASVADDGSPSGGDAPAADGSVSDDGSTDADDEGTLPVPAPFADRFARFREHLRAEAAAIGDDLERELAVLDRLIAAAED